MSERMDQSQSASDVARDAELAGWLAHFGPALRRFFGRRVAPDEIDDLVQEVFLRLHVASARVPADNVDRYMFTIARNVLVDQHRRRQARGGYPTRLLSGMNESVDHLNPERIAIGQDEYACAVRAILSLPPRARMAFQLHRFDHMTYQTIAVHMGISKESVKELIHRAIVHVSSRMEMAT